MKDVIADIKQLDRVSLVAGLVVGLGIILWMFASKAFVLLLALGAFGPGIAREMGWFKDHDEFQRHAAHRAGYHAYLFSGVLLAMFAVVVTLDTQPVDTAEILRFLLLASWIAWMFSSLLEYWGAQRTTSRILLVFGFFWLLFVAANFVNPDAQPGTPWWEHALGFAFGTSIVALFFVPAWGAHRKPRLTGWILLIAGVGLTVFLSGGDNLPRTTRLMTNTMLMVPMIVCGLALLIEQRNSSGTNLNEDEDEDH